MLNGHAAPFRFADYLFDQLGPKFSMSPLHSRTHGAGRNSQEPRVASARLSLPFQFARRAAASKNWLNMAIFSGSGPLLLGRVSIFANLAIRLGRIVALSHEKGPPILERPLAITLIGAARRPRYPEHCGSNPNITSVLIDRSSLCTGAVNLSSLRPRREPIH